MIIIMTMVGKRVTDMLFETPDLGFGEEAVLSQLSKLRETTRLYIHEPRRWHGPLRRQAFARAIRGSNTIEGYTLDVDDAAAVAMGEAPLDTHEETRLAYKGYSDAMTYILQLADDEGFAYSEQLLKSLHFMMTSYDLKKRPGRWRQGAIYVRDSDSGDIVYEGADIEEVPRLVAALVSELNAADGSPPTVRAAMAHLNLVLIHPFTDGNGRMARCLQSLVLAREGILSPVFVNIEEYLGRKTEDYYRVLADVGGGRWQPSRDARPWLRFALTAHLHQARLWFRRIKESERLWGDLEALVARRGLPERTMVALFDAASRFRVRNSTYRRAFEDTPDEIEEATATRDLRQLVEAGLLVKHGIKRGTYYTAASDLQDVRQAIIDARDPADESDPFAGI